MTLISKLRTSVNAYSPANSEGKHHDETCTSKMVQNNRKNVGSLR